MALPARNTRIVETLSSRAQRPLGLALEVRNGVAHHRFTKGQPVGLPRPNLLQIVVKHHGKAECGRQDLRRLPSSGQ